MYVPIFDKHNKGDNCLLLKSTDDRNNNTVAELQKALFPPVTPNRSSTVISEGGGHGVVSVITKCNQDRITSVSMYQERLRNEEEKHRLFSTGVPPQPARWPIECQVLENRVNHIEYIPPTPEPYYESTDVEPQPQPVGSDIGTVVFEYHPVSPVSYFTRSAVGGSVAPLQDRDFDGLQFESRFESGNLGKAVCITSTYYELYIRSDLYTNKHHQWFYFRISNMRRHNIYRISIVNFAKPDSLYNEGMKPLMYSTKDAQLHSIGWRRCGKNISYFANENSLVPITLDGDTEYQPTTYTLTFTLEFPHDKDEVYIASCYPYTYSELQDYLFRISTHPIKSKYSSLRLLCRTLAGNNVYYLTITSPSPQPNNNNKDKTNSPPKKRAIVLSARVHPGETPASWMMKGMIDFLTGDSAPARELREKFIFKLIPMLNPDGVIVGNNRCSLTGRDLNRQYRTVIRETYPSVWHTKLMVRRLLEDCGVAMYCDLHAHSRKHNIFIYGCESRRNSEKRLQEQVFPLMLHKNSADKFSFEDCKFRIQRAKEGTGRVVIWLLGVCNSYTLEASFGGSKLAGRAATHFTPNDYESVGKSFCETLLDFSDEHPSKERLRTKILTRLLKTGSSADEPTNIVLSDYSSDDGDTSSEDSQDRLITMNGNDISMPVPPASPQKKHRRTLKKKDNKLIRSPNNTRVILPVYRQTLDWPTTDPGSDYYDSADERLGVKPKKPGRIRTRYGDVTRSAFENMPPELMVLSNTNGGSRGRMSRPRSQSVIVVQDKPAENWHRLRSLPPPRQRQRHPPEIQERLTQLRQQIWSGIGFSPEGPLSWGISVMAATAYQNECEALLRSCSQKLLLIGKDGNGKKDKIKKKKIIKTEERPSSKVMNKTIKKKPLLKPRGSDLKISEPSTKIENKSTKFKKLSKDKTFIRNQIVLMDKIFVDETNQQPKTVNKKKKRRKKLFANDDE
ncbi:cytosolic carboxypeptidase Nna1-like isoform X4 [Chrysoperla carnea]|uniref:cytosolic carboxypeptidase Nna1-like isoform X4 n=1 Tax=Chrysoperla carnea TaxID=189513 RepID=UPI001D069803|nr:cytosolic carboxypeptidase Nna1-like isoform X4 [Chrysoperla carnea]